MLWYIFILKCHISRQMHFCSGPLLEKIRVIEREAQSTELLSID